MSHKLRPYQDDAVEGSRDAIIAGENPVIVVPVGGGKTTIGADIVRKAVAKGNPVLWIAHRVELLEQARERLAGYGIDAGLVKGGSPVTDSPVQVASMQTLVRRKRKPAARLIIVDEAHRIRSASYANILAAYPGVPVVGLTATPARTDGRGLGDVFQRIVMPVTVLELIDQGFLTAPTYYATSQPDFTGVKTIGGEYDTSGSASVMMRPSLVGDVVDHFNKYRTPGLPGLTFACSIAHSHRLRDAYVAAGLKAVHVDGNTPAKVREGIMDDLRNARVDVVVSVDITTEGLDVPGLGIVQLCRPTHSWSLHTQMLGRVARVHPGKTKAVVLDHVGNLNRHGFLEDVVEFDLNDKKRKKGDPSKAKTCRVCLASVPVATPVCPVCRTPFPIRPRAPLAEESGSLVEVTPNKASEEEKSRECDRLLGVAKSLGYFRKWVTEKYRLRFGVAPRGKWYGPMVREHLEGCTHVLRTSAGWCKFCHEGMAEEDKPRWAKGKARW